MKFITTSILLIVATFTYGQLTLEKDINIEAASSSPGFYFTELDGIIYFPADDGTHDIELHQYDTQQNEASLVSNLRTEEGQSGVAEVIAYAGKIYFASKANGSTNYLYVYDPITKETTQLRDSNNQRIRKPTNFHIYDDRLFYTSEVSNNADEVHVYDATTNATRSLGNVRQDGRSNAGNYNTVGDKLYFKAYAADDDSNIFFYDMDTDTIHRYEYQAPNGIYGVANQLTHFDGWLFYVDASEVLRGTTTAIKLSTGVAKTFSIFENTTSGENPNEFFEFDGKLYFSAISNSPKRAVFAFDPTTEEITKVLQIMTDASTAPFDFLSVGGKMYFVAQVSTDDNPKYHIYSYDPSTDQFTAEATLADENSVGEITLRLAHDGRLYCSGYREDVGKELFVFDPLTKEITLVADINLNTASANPYSFTNYNGQLYFTASAYRVGDGIWKYDSSTGSTESVSYEVSRPRALIAINGRLYFDGSHPDSGYGLNYYDAATDEVVATNWRSPSCINCMSNFTIYDGKIYMSAEMDSEIGNELYAYDPTTDTGELIIDVAPDADGHPEIALVYNDDLYFYANMEGKDRLMKYNALSNLLTIVADKDSEEVIDAIGWVTELDGQIYFRGRGLTEKYELFSYDPATETVHQITNEENGIRPTDFTVTDGKLFFAGTPNNTIGRELHSYDPATETVQLELDLTPGGGGSLSYWRNITSFNNKLYFSHSNAEYGNEFWEYSAGEAKIIADIRQGALGSNPTLFTKFNNKLYFTADDGSTGYELWSFASCINATVETTPQTTTSLGTVDINVSGGTPPYSYIWNDGETTEDRLEASAGPYAVTIYDQAGCVANISVVVQFSTATNDLQKETQLHIFPNPSQGTFSVNLPTASEGMLYVRTSTGQLLYARKVSAKHTSYNVDLTGHPTGMYILQVATDKLHDSRMVVLRN